MAAEDLTVFFNQEGSEEEEDDCQGSQLQLEPRGHLKSHMLMSHVYHVRVITRGAGMPMRA